MCIHVCHNLSLSLHLPYTDIERVSSVMWVSGIPPEPCATLPFAQILRVSNKKMKRCEVKIWRCEVKKHVARSEWISGTCRTVSIRGPNPEVVICARCAQKVLMSSSTMDFHRFEMASEVCRCWKDDHIAQCFRWATACHLWKKASTTKITMTSMYGP